MDNKFVFKSIELIKSPGLRNSQIGEIDNLNEGLNIITGSNGSGKTTLSKCFLSTLQPESAFIATATAQDGENLIRLDSSLKNKRLENSSKYSLHIEDFLKQTKIDSGLEASLRSEIYSGIDLDAIDCSVTFPKKIVSEINEIKSEVEEHERRIVQNQEALGEIKKLEETLKTQDELNRNLEKLKKAKELGKLSRELEAKKEEFASFDAHLAEIEKNDYAYVLQKREQIKQKEADVEALEEEMAFLKQQQGALEIDEALALDRQKVQTLALYEEDLKHASLRLDDLNKQLGLKKNELDSIKQDLGSLVDLPTLAQAKELSTFASGIEQRQSSYLVCKKRLELLQNQVSKNSQSSEALMNLRSLIKQQIKKEELENKTKQKEVLKPFLICLGVLALGSLFAVLLNSIFVYAGSALLCILSFFLLKKKKEDKDTNEALLKNIEDVLGASLSYLDALVLIANKLTELSFEKETQERVLKLEEELKRIENDYQDFLQSYETVASSIGLSLENIKSAPFYDYSSRLSLAFKVKTEYEGLEKTVKDQENLIQNYISQVASLITVKDPRVSSICPQIEQIKKLSEEYVQLFNKIESKQSLKANLENDLTRIKDELAEFISKKGNLSDSDLENLCKLKDQWQSKKSEIELLANTIDKSDFEIKELSKLEDLEYQLDQAQRRVSGLVEQSNKLGMLNTHYKQIIDDETYNTCKRSYETKREELFKIWQDNSQKEVKEALKNKILGLFEKTQQPLLIQRANEILKSFTNNKEGIEFSLKEVRLKDFETGLSKNLNELSSGMKVQLLIALKLASIESFENQGLKYPLFIDEALANSDDARSIEIANIIVKIAKERQVFYFTAQKDEVDNFVNLDKDAKVIDLDAQRAKTVLTYQPSKTHKRLQTPSYDFSCDYQSWMKQNHISSSSLFEPITNLSSWYLFTDSQSLQTCLNKGFDTIGKALSSTSYNHLSSAVEALQTAQTMAKIGRAKLVTKHEISQMVEQKIIKTSSNYYSQILSLLDNPPITGLSLIAALDGKKVQNLSKSTKTAIIEFLTENQFVEDLNQKKPLMNLLDAIDNIEQFDLNQKKLAKQYLEVLCD